MSKVIPLGDHKFERDHRNIHEDLDEKLSDIFAVASLLGEVNGENIGPEQVNATGYCLTRMITEAQKLSKEHYELWKGDAK